MEKTVNNLTPVFSHVEPVFAVENITDTLQYWNEVLGFPGKWMWGEPPTHGGVSWQKVFIQFTKNPALAAASKGNSIWVRVQRIQLLYELHQKNNASIVAPLEQQPWGMAQYTIKEINGYYVHFAGHLSERKKSEPGLPNGVRISGRKPTVHEYQELGAAVYNSQPLSNEGAQARLNAIIYAAVAEDTVTNKVIGCALLAGDNSSFYYVKDVIVHPVWQGKRIGTAMMQELNNWLNMHGAENAIVSLVSSETLEPFYQQFGFTQTFGMIKYIEREK